MNLFEGTGWWQLAIGLATGKGSLTKQEMRGWTMYLRKLNKAWGLGKDKLAVRVTRLRQRH